MQRCDKMSNMVASEVLSGETASTRAKTITRWINVATLCRKYNNFASLLQVRMFVTVCVNIMACYSSLISLISTIVIVCHKDFNGCYCVIKRFKVLYYIVG